MVSYPNDFLLKKWGVKALSEQHGLGILNTIVTLTVTLAARSGRRGRFYDGSGQRVRFYDGSGQRVRFYDGSGRRVRFYDGSGWRVRFYDGSASP